MGHLDCWGSLPAAWHSFSWLSLTFVSRLVWSLWWLFDYSVPRWLHKPKSSYLHHRAWHLVSGVYTDLLCLFGFWLKCCCVLQPSTNILLLSVQRTLILKAKPRCHPNKLYVFSLSSSALMNFNFNMLTEANWNVALMHRLSMGYTHLGDLLLTTPECSKPANCQNVLTPADHQWISCNWLTAPSC